MHSALLIDEILRQIFSFNSGDARPSLVSAALTCKAWKDPALDFVWDQLSSFGPLLSLLPTITDIVGQYGFITQPSQEDLQRFNSYARRIKHVSNRRELNVHPSIERSSLFSTASALPNLSTAYISLPKTTTYLISLNFSTNLVRLEVDLGFKAVLGPMSDALCEYLEQNSGPCSKLRHLSLRGRSSNRLNAIISRLTNLESISLKLGSSLLPQTFQAVTHWPRLLKLEIHAGQIEFNDLHDTHDPHASQDYTIFPSLATLYIRAKSVLIEIILHYIPPNTLRHLHIELDDSSSCMGFWKPGFISIANKTVDTLHHLALEHHFETTDPSTSSLSPIPFQSASGLDVSGIDFQTIEYLNKLKNLRHFSCDITLPPTISDQDLKKIVTWWPNLQHFELGSSDQFEIAKPSQLSLASLSLFAHQVPQLRTLVLPLIISDPLPPPSVVTQPAKAHSLQHLTITQLETAYPVKFIHYLYSLFPSIKSIEGPCGQAWEDAITTLESLNSAFSSSLS
ncbi:hypothetical protein BDN70DRAFT_934095 [Pholiota conissans]|uniref:F-box domain-containing protein n=1 Tax=Pholiota conissans TaxID=109636 RepID=A0A9P5YYM7_9AGAR|nr:hypothetical protein BDN70DRAFT_934095 [Pholiota conissans]